MESPQSVWVTVEGQKLLNFSSNDYLGLANHPQVKDAFIKGAERWGVGSGSAHLVCGHSHVHHALEEELAEFTGGDRALLFSTGYMANLGALSALIGKGDWVLQDRLNHASLLDGGLLSGARFQRYGHRDMQSLGRFLQRGKGERTLVVSDGVFSMDGDLAPLPELVAAAKSAGADVMIDDAHGLGVLGDNGGGIMEYYQVPRDDIAVLVGTLGKAFGTFGAFVSGSHDLIENLIQRARTYMYTTSVPPAVAAATRTSLQLAKAETWRREKLRNLIRRFRLGIEQLGLDAMDSITPIQPILVGDNDRAVRFSRKLKSLGFLITAIRPPTVPEGSARLRISLCALHEEHDVDAVLDALAETVTAYG